MLLVLVCTFLQLVDRQGGMLGNILVSILTPAIGVVGTYVVDIILMIICVVIITGKSLLQGVKTQGDKAYDKAKKDAAKRRERTQALRTERALKSKQTEKENLCPDRELNEVTGMWKASPLTRHWPGNLRRSKN